jgi:talin
MAKPLTLRIHIVKTNTMKMMQFDEITTVQDACALIEDRIPEASHSQSGDCGMFKADEDPKKGRWLDASRTLDYYSLKNGDTIEYRTKVRPLRVRTIDETVKTILVDDSMNVRDLIKMVAEKIGLKNPEEYSFVTEKDWDAKKGQKGVRGQKKMDTLRKKWHTDDEFHWLNHDKSLREQGVDETEVLGLRKRLFFKDANIDQNDPVQVNLVYAQVKEDIIDGTHPVSKDEAVHLSALQCQALYGNYNEAKHKPGFLTLAEFLPKEYVKVKGIEKIIFQEHRKHFSMSELSAKYRYITKCRSMSTYGVTFFLVKEKLKGRNKLVPRLLGISRSSVMRVDENTKEVLQRWELTSVKRWAASTNSFTLDFGDYREGYYSVQTGEGESISQLLGGYIDLILKSEKPKLYEASQEDDDNEIVEETVTGKTGNVTQLHGVGRSRASDGSVDPLSSPGVALITGDVFMGGPNQQQGTASGGIKHDPDDGFDADVKDMRRRVRGDITDVEDRVKVVMDLLTTSAEGGSSDVARENISATIAAILASAATIMALTDEDPTEANYSAVGSAVVTATTNLDELARSLSMLLALESDNLDGDQLKDAAKLLANAMAGLMNHTKPENWEDRKQLQAYTEQIAEACAQLLAQSEDITADRRAQEILTTLATAVASSTSALITHAEKIASTCEDDAMRDRIYAAAKDTAAATEGLLLTAKLLGPTADYSLCQEQITEACKSAIGEVQKLVLAVQCACDDDNTLKDLGVAAKAVTESLNNLLLKLKENQTVGDTSRSEEAYRAVVAAAESLLDASATPQQLLERAKRLAEATDELMRLLKLESDDRDISALLDAAKAVSDASSKLLNTAKVASKDDNPQNRRELQVAVEELQSACGAAVSTAQKRAALRKLRASAKNTYAANVQLIAASYGVKPFNPDESSQANLLAHCKAVSDQLAGLAKHLRASGRRPDSPHAQLELIGSSQDVLLPSAKMVQAARNTAAHVEKHSAATQLVNISRVTTAALTNLKNSVEKASDVCGSLEIDCAIEVVRALGREIDGYKGEVRGRRLLLQPDETLPLCATELGAAAKNVGSAMAQLLAAADQGNESYTGKASRETANSLQNLTRALRGVAAGTEGEEEQCRVLDAGQQVLEQSEMLLSEVRNAVDMPNQPNKKLRLAQSAKSVSQALNQVVNCLPGQREIEAALNTIREAMKEAEGIKPPKGQSYQTLQSNVSAVASDLNSLANEFYSVGRNNPEKLAPIATAFARKFSELVHAGMALAAASQDKEMEKAMLGHLRAVSISSSKILLSAKTLGADPSAPNALNQLSAAARGVTDAINDMLNILSSAGPGLKECEDALRKIQAVQGVLDSPNQPVVDATFFPCLDTVVEMSQKISANTQTLPGMAKSGEFAKYGETVLDTGDAVCKLAECAAHAAYLVGISDPTSKAAQPGLVDHSKFVKAKEAIISAAHTLGDQYATREEILKALGIVTKQGGYLISGAREASEKTANPVAKKHFADSSKKVLAETEAVVKGVRDQVKQGGKGAHSVETKPLLDAVADLVTFASSPSFATTPAVIGQQGREAMSPILTAGQSVMGASRNMLSACKNLAVDPEDRDVWQRFANNSKALSEALKDLIAAIRDTSPGQQECDTAIDTITKAIAELDSASMAIVTQSLQPDASTSLHELHEQVLQNLADIKEAIGPLSTASKGKAEVLGHSVTAFATLFPSLSTSAVSLASKTRGQQQQSTVLDQTKTVAESATQMVFACKSAGGNPKSSEHGKVDESVEMMKEATAELEETLQKASRELGFINQMVQRVTEASEKVEKPRANPGDTFAAAHHAMNEAVRNVAKKVQDVSQPSQDLPHIRQDVQELVDSYCKLAEAASVGIATSDTPDVAEHLKLGVQSLGGAMVSQLGALGTFLADEDARTKRDLISTTKALKEKLSFMLGTLQSASKGTQACEEASSMISGMVSDLETSAMFASYGALKSETQGTGAFVQHHREMLGSSAELLLDLDSLVAGTSGSQDQLAIAARKTMVDMNRATEATKLASTALNDNSDFQMSLLNSAKNVAKSLIGVLDSCKVNAGKPPNDPALKELKVKSKEAKESVKTFTDTANQLKDVTGRASMSLQQTIAAIEEELKAYDSSEIPAILITPEELLHLVNGVMNATARAVSACNSQNQEELVTASTLGRKMVDLLKGCKVASANTSSEDAKVGVKRSGRECTVAYLDLLKHVESTFGAPTPDKKKKMLDLSGTVAKKVGVLTKEVQKLKGEDWVNPNDPAVIAEKELLKAAASIEAAARKLEELQPRRKVTVDESLTFNEQIVEAAKSIATATNGLIRAARDAQRELIAQGKLKKFTAGSEDSQFADGLISAAKQVAEATNILCEAANNYVTEEGDEDELISAAKSVAAGTTALLMACNVKSEWSSVANERLQDAGVLVKKATNQLVQSAQKVKERKEEETLVVRPGGVPGITGGAAAGSKLYQKTKQEWLARAEVYKIEKELRDARERLTNIQKQK